MYAADCGRPGGCCAETCGEETSRRKACLEGEGTGVVSPKITDSSGDSGQVGHASPSRGNVLAASMEIFEAKRRFGGVQERQSLCRCAGLLASHYYH